MKSRSILEIVVPLLFVLAAPAAAHPLAPSLLDVREREPGLLEVAWRTPLLQPAGADLRPELPSHCAPVAAPVAEREASRLTLRWTEDCGARGIIGAPLRVLGLDRSRTDALVRVELRDGRRLQAVLSGADAAFVVPERQRPARVAIDYAALGVEHILSGLDHLLFVLGLVLLVQSRRVLLYTVTAFTLGHSVTLSLAVLGIVSFPPRLVELAIAGSILVLAVELSRPGDAHLLRRRPWALAFAFGLSRCSRSTWESSWDSSPSSPPSCCSGRPSGRASSAAPPGSAPSPPTRSARSPPSGVSKEQPRSSADSGAAVPRYRSK
jgi:hypothetical protein